MFPCLRSPRNIMGNNVSATMCPRLPGLLRSSENCTIAVAGRSGKINQRQCSTPGLAIGWFFRFCFRLRQPSFQDHKRRSRKQNRKKGKRSDYSDSAYDSDFRFSLGHKVRLRRWWKPALSCNPSAKLNGNTKNVSYVLRVYFWCYEVHKILKCLFSRF